MFRSSYRNGLLLLLILVIKQVTAQNIVPDSLVVVPSAEEVGISSSRLNKIDTMIKKAITEKEIPGAVALIVKDGKVVYHKSFGVADAEGRKLLKDNIFRIASQTKAITATAVMMLWEEGKFQLDDPISTYIPDFKNPQLIDTFNEEDSTYTTKPAGKEITI
ncbi:MAG: serine hydrolase domain-containing protein, partial [Salegentibacter sp.]